MAALTELEKLHLDTPFRGSRDYVHSTSLYDAISEKLNISDMWLGSLKINRFTSQQCMLSMHNNHGSQAVGQISIVSSDNKTIAYIIETENSIAERVAFDEAHITNTANIADETISNKWLQDISFIDQCVSLTKKLHEQTLPTTEGKWVFTAINTNTNTYKKKPANISIQIDKKLGDRMTRSLVFLDSEQIGHIDFAVH